MNPTLNHCGSLTVKFSGALIVDYYTQTTFYVHLSWLNLAEHAQKSEKYINNLQRGVTESQCEAC